MSFCFGWNFSAELNNSVNLNLLASFNSFWWFILFGLSPTFDTRCSGPFFEIRSMYSAIVIVFILYRNFSTTVDGEFLITADCCRCNEISVWFIVGVFSVMRFIVLWFSFQIIFFASSSMQFLSSQLIEYFSLFTKQYKCFTYVFCIKFCVNICFGLLMTAQDIPHLHFTQR